MYGAFTVHRFYPDKTLLFIPIINFMNKQKKYCILFYSYVK